MKMTLFFLLVWSLVFSSVHGTLIEKCSVKTFQAGVLASDVTIEKVVPVRKGSSFGEGAANPAYPIDPTNLPELCAVIVRVKTSRSSSFRFGLFLPTEWNSRFLAVGNGAFAGGINWLDMGAGVQYGFASMSTDTGHNSTAIDLTWAFNNEEKRKDFGFRAMHESVDMAKQLIARFYGKRADFSYYSGCSTGGRQGLREVQANPDSFDGILVGAPAWWLSHLTTWTTKTGIYNLPVDAAGHIPVPLFFAITAEVIKQCDSQDNVPDGIVSAPDSCDFKLEAMLCGRPGVPSNACLTEPQIETAKKLYSDYFAAGKFAFPGYSRSSEDLWFITLGGTEPSPLGADYIRYFLLNDPNWPWQAYNDSLVGLADTVDPGKCDADNYAMTPFRRSGGKIIMYHGYADGLIPTRSSNYFYQQVANRMGGVDALRDWFRYFLIPGMGHCGGTSQNAPYYIAGANQAGIIGNDTHSVPGFEDSKHDALLALMDWVEKGKVVKSIVATTWNNPTDATTGVRRQRPLCPYPEVAVYDGSGNVDDATSWKCSRN